ncbi:MAG: hydrogenase expression/formation C-terminal domain-containing protein [Pseudomonadota bacterium]|nr:hydrogenase expression/formation C-terminal domain-containing protein [Pseudomonadota bacterium]
MNGNASSCGQAAGSDDLITGNVNPILNEIRHALKKLLEEGESTIIDLRALPLGPGEELQLESLLGIGEVTANIDAMGPSTVNETLFAGVWLVTHRNTEDAILGKFIEITRYPSILESQAADMRSALKALPGLLTENS